MNSWIKFKDAKEGDAIRIYISLLHITIITRISFIIIERIIYFAKFHSTSNIPYENLVVLEERRMRYWGKQPTTKSPIYNTQNQYLDARKTPIDATGGRLNWAVLFGYFFLTLRKSDTYIAKGATVLRNLNRVLVDSADSGDLQKNVLSSRDRRSEMGICFRQKCSSDFIRRTWNDKKNNGGNYWLYAFKLCQ